MNAYVAATMGAPLDLLDAMEDAERIRSREIELLAYNSEVKLAR